ncbi:MAG: DUF423 domain-containing protein [Gemmatimonadaceae bacterium]|nr:DUF423 domain-containing protein [Gemmatimonadaceae bacterium]
MDATFVRLGALSAAVAVGAGAFGAHALRARLTPEMLAVFETAARYQMYHALGIVLAAFVMARRSRRVARAAGWFFAVGTVCFSGALYALALSGVRALGAVAPVGGASFLAGWICMAIAARPGTDGTGATLRGP